MEKKSTDHKQKKEQETRPHMDNPEHLKTDEESIYDMHEDMQNVDPIPLEDLKQEMEDEKDHRKSKNRSSSEEKYPGS